MLAAIREVAAATATEPKVFEPEPKRQDTAERRQVTVMFSDLVGSTALSARMDPEDLREVISAYQKCVAETVRRFDGFVAKYMGDGVLVYFGYPQAHEDDAERAVRAGLALITCSRNWRNTKTICPAPPAPSRLCASIGVCPNWERMRFASVRCSTARGRLFLVM